MSAKLAIKQTVASMLHSVGALSMFGATDWRIITYHRILSPEKFPYPVQPGMYVRPACFKMQMRYLARSANVLSLDELVNSLLSGEPLPPRAVAITFDDGWRDNYLNAFPILKEYKLPATLFLATSFIETNNIFWTDLAGLFIRCLHLPSGVSDISEKLRRPFELSTREQFLSLVPRLKAAPPPDAVDMLVHFIGAQERKERILLLSFIRSAIPEDLLKIVKDSFVTWKQVAEMASHGVTMGSHTHNHDVLSELKGEGVKYEMEHSRKLIKEHCDNHTKIFCYPGGFHNEISAAMLCLMGAPAALTVAKGSDFSINPPHLGRTGIHQDISATESMFAARIWFNKYY